MTADEHFLAGKSIIIAGGGIAGSAFTVALHSLWGSSLPPPTITILERDSEDVVNQREGYSLSLAGFDDTGGLAALKKLGLLEAALEKAVAGTDQGSFKIWGADWKTMLSMSRKPLEGMPTSSLRIARKELRQILHDSITNTEAASILWNTQCLSATRSASGRICIQTQTGPDGIEDKLECDLLIAADGANSKIRSSLRPNDKLQYAGANLRGGLSRFQGPLPEPLNRDWGFQISGDGVSCFYSPVDQHSVVWAVGHMEKDRLPPLDPANEKAGYAVVTRGRELGARFAEPFNTIVEHTDLSAVMSLNAHDKMPFAHDNIDKTPIIYIGDCNHALSPFSGYGANLALNDGWDLAQKLCDSRYNSISKAVRAYDEISVPRAAKIVKASRRRLKLGHSTGFKLWLFCAMLVVGKFIERIFRRRQ